MKICIAWLKDNQHSKARHEGLPQLAGDITIQN